MSVLLRLAFFVFLSIAPAVFGQSSRMREFLKTDPRFAYKPANLGADSGSGPGASAKLKPFELSHSLERALDEHFAKQLGPRDFISLGLKSIENNFNAPDVFSQGKSWRSGDDLSLRLRTKLVYNYSPRQIPSNPGLVFERAIIRPLSLLAGKTFGF